MFSEELYELDKNTVEYMIDEMQETVDKQKQTISELQDTIQQTIRGTVMILRNLKVSEPEIITQVCGQYHLSEKEVRDYL